MGRVARGRARHVRSLWRTCQPPVHRVWMPPHRTRLRVDRAWRLARRAIRLALHARGVWKGRGGTG
jgi:hypothetical protein